MKKILLSSLIALSSLTFYTNASAAMRASVALSPTSYSLSNPVAGTTAASSSYMGIDWSLTYALEKAYFGVNIATSLDSGTEHDLYNISAPFDRSETTFTLGYPLSNTSSIFAGFRSASSTFGNNTFNRNLVFKASGLFGGMSLGTTIGDNATLSASAAGALMSGTLTGLDNLAPGTNYNATADSTFGFSLSAAINYFLSDNSGISLKGSFQGYSYVGWSDPNKNIGDLNENIFAIGASYFMSF